MSNKLYNDFFSSIEINGSITDKQALELLNIPAYDLPNILALANDVRINNFGESINLCSITNAKSGACEEDCAFCAQSGRYNTTVDTYNLKDHDQLFSLYEKTAETLPIDHFSIVTSGDAITQNDLKQICDAIKTGEINGTAWCASLGSLSVEQLKRLKDAGLSRFHHNLETAESFFSTICTTHTFDDRLAMIRRIKKARLQLCCGALLGLGESLEQRVELASIFNREEIDSIPLNFHVPIPGTLLENNPPMDPIEILKTVAMFRLKNPSTEIKVCAGRIYLRDMQSMLFYAGATGMMIGPLLTVAGRNVDDDLQMLKDLCLPIKNEA